MKKTLAVLAVLAVAAVAHADLLASWTFPDPVNQNKVRNDEASGGLNVKVDYSDLQRSENLSNPNTSANTKNKFFAAQGWGGEANSESIFFTATIAQNYEIVDATLSAGGVNGANGGPKYMSWELNGDPLANSTWTVAYNSTASSVSDVSVGKMSAGVNTLSLVRAGTEAVSASAINNNGGNFRLLNSLSLSGTVQEASSPTPQVPEPATMSLLGLGALAMVLRRKLRK